MNITDNFEAFASRDIKEAKTVEEAYYAGADAVVALIETLHKRSKTIETFFEELHELCDYIAEKYSDY